MLTLFFLLAFGLTNASPTPTPKNGIYVNSDFGIEVTVDNGAATLAKIYDAVIPLSNNNNTFYGSVSSGPESENTTISVSVTTNSKKKLSAEATITRVLPKNPVDQSYYFKKLGIQVVTSNDLISEITIGKMDTTYTNITFNDDGSINSCQMESKDLYKLTVDESEIKDFWCKGCSYQILGNEIKNIVTVSDATFIKLYTNSIEFIREDGVKQIIKNPDGTSVDISTYFYNGDEIASNKLLNNTVTIAVDKDNIRSKNTSTLLLHKKAL